MQFGLNSQEKKDYGYSLKDMLWLLYAKTPNEIDAELKLYANNFTSIPSHSLDVLGGFSIISARGELVDYYLKFNTNVDLAMAWPKATTLSVENIGAPKATYYVSIFDAIDGGFEMYWKNEEIFSMSRYNSYYASYKHNTGTNPYTPATLFRSADSITSGNATSSNTQLSANTTNSSWINRGVVHAAVDSDTLSTIPVIATIKPCQCKSSDLFNFGCQCGAVSKYKP